MYSIPVVNVYEQEMITSDFLSEIHTALFWGDGGTQTDRKRFLNFLTTLTALSFPPLDESQASFSSSSPALYFFPQFFTHPTLDFFVSSFVDPFIALLLLLQRKIPNHARKDCNAVKMQQQNDRNRLNRSTVKKQ